MRIKRFRLPAAAICILSLLLTSCGSGSAGGDSGMGKWRNSDIAGSISAEEQIRPQDDFAAAVNQEWSVNAEPGTSAFMTVQLSVMDKKQQLLDQDYSDHDGRELNKFYDLAADWEGRNADGTEPLRPYMDAIASISSLEDLTAYACDTAMNPLGLGILMPGTPTQSEADPTASLMTISPPAYLLDSPDQYFDLTPAGLEKQAYVEQVAGHVLGSLGYKEPEIRKLLRDCFRFEKKLADTEVQMSSDDLKAISLSREECIQAAPGYPLDRILDARGIPQDGRFYMKAESAQKIARLFTEDNLSQIMAMLMVHLAIRTADWLDRETYDLNRAAQVSRLAPPPENGTGLPADRKEQAILQACVMESALGPILDRLYVETFADDINADALSDMTEALIASMRQLFREETWLSEEGKAACIDKLDAMGVHIVSPDFDMVSYDGLSIRPRGDGGTFLEAMFAAEQVRSDHYARVLTIPFDRNRWDPLDAIGITTTETNAIYMPARNGIYIFAGILESPIYTPDMSREELLGGIGVIVGHEITHAFDKGGALYNKDGIEDTWMSIEDQMAFSDRCDMVIQYYNQLHPVPGAGSYNGLQVSDEATADMGGLRIALASAAQESEFDYDTFFRQFARIWATATTADREQKAFSADVHPLPFLRVNVGLQQFEEFYETYGIKKGDGMYLPADKRISVW